MPIAAASAPRTTRRPTPTTRACRPRCGGEVDDIGRGFFRALFDLSFRTFITRRLASVFYLVGLIAIAIGFIVYFVSGLVNGINALFFNLGAGISLIVATLILVPICHLPGDRRSSGS